MNCTAAGDTNESPPLLNADDSWTLAVNNSAVATIILGVKIFIILELMLDGELFVADFGCWIYVVDNSIPSSRILSPPLVCVFVAVIVVLLIGAIVDRRSSIFV